MTTLRILAVVCLSLAPAWARAQLPADFSFVQGNVFAVDATGRIITRVKSFEEPIVELLYQGAPYKIMLTESGPEVPPNNFNVGLLYVDVNCSTQPLLAVIGRFIKVSILIDGTLYIADPSRQPQLLATPGISNGGGRCGSPPPLHLQTGLKIETIAIPNFMTGYPLPWRITTSPFTNGGPVSNVPVPGLFTAPAASSSPRLTIATP